MKKTKKYLGTLLVVLMTFSLSACSKTTNQSQESQKVELTISAASSLKDAMDELKNIYLNDNKNVDITYNLGSSGSLQKQIENGAEVDLFISAGVKQMDELEKGDLLLDESRRDLLGNEIVLIVPSDSSFTADFKNLNIDEIDKIAVGEPSSVPVGQYTEEVFNKFNISHKIKSKIIYAKDVKEVLNWVETGNVDAGVVYESDAKLSDKVKKVAVAPEGSHKPIVYPASVIKESKNTKEAKAFLDFLSSEKAKEVFEKHGFIFLD
jgi:molybdate transport system substrate-binding protein